MASQADLEALIAEAKAGRLKPLVLVYGDQGYLVKQAYDRLLEALVAPDLRSFNVEQMDGARADIGSVLDSFNTMPMMPGNKVLGVVDARFFQSKANAAEVLKKAAQRWEAAEAGAALRGLGGLLSLAEWTWEQALAFDGERWALEFDLKDGEASAPWIKEALRQAISSQLPQPPKGDESGRLADELEAAMKLGGEGLFLVCKAENADARKRLYKLFQTHGHVLDFKIDRQAALNSVTARAFLSESLKQRGLSLKPGLGERIVAAYGWDLGVLQMELEKLEAFAYPRKELEDGDLKAVGTPVAEAEAFALLNALGANNLGLALAELRRQVEREKGAAYMVFGQLNSEVRKLLVMRALIDEGEVGGKGRGDFASFKANVYPALLKKLPPGLALLFKKTNPFPLHLAIERAKAFSAARLHFLAGTLAELDVESKVGAVGMEQALEEIVLRLCGVQEETLL